MTKIEVAYNIQDENGESQKDRNLKKNHGVELGALVELESGVRLFVVNHSRDCDGTPLYDLYLNLDIVDDVNEVLKNIQEIDESIAVSKDRVEMVELQQAKKMDVEYYQKCARKTDKHYGEQSLVVIREPSVEIKEKMKDFSLVYGKSF